MYSTLHTKSDVNAQQELDFSLQVFALLSERSCTQE